MTTRKADAARRADAKPERGRFARKLAQGFVIEIADAKRDRSKQPVPESEREKPQP
jgi:hypothetical protein